MVAIDSSSKVTGGDGAGGRTPPVTVTTSSYKAFSDGVDYRSAYLPGKMSRTTQEEPMDRTDDIRDARTRVRARLRAERRRCHCRWVEFPRPHLCAESRCRVHAHAEAQYDGDVSIQRLAVQLRLF